MKKIKLGEVLDIRRGTSLSGDYYATQGNYVRLTLGNFNYPDNGFKFNTSKDDIYFIGNVREEFILKAGDIITPLTEQVRGLLGNTATIPESDKYIQSGDVGLVIPNEYLIDKRFAYYLISSPVVKKQLDAGSQQTKIRHTSPESIKDCIAFIPSIEQQQKIAKLLDSINSKIENNSAINNNLEQQAMALYDYYFTQFDFPNQENKPYRISNGDFVWSNELKSNIPLGWCSISLSDIINILSGFAFSSDSYVENGKYPLYTIKNVQHSGIVSSVDNYIDVLPSNMPEYCLLKSGDILTSLTGNVGRVGIVYEDNALLNQRVAKLSPKEQSLYPFVLFTMKSKLIRKKIETIAIGSSQANISPLDIAALKIPFNKDIALLFSKNIQQIVYKYISNMKENASLIKLRNFLLPMLMNGQAKIDN